MCTTMNIQECEVLTLWFKRYLVFSKIVLNDTDISIIHCLKKKPGLLRLI